MSFPVHEFSHAYVANLLGDDSAKKAGRLTLNPLQHVDFVGLLCLFIAGFGWAKPVPIDLKKFNKPKRDMALVSLAGPISNLLLALLGVFLSKLVMFLEFFDVNLIAFGKLIFFLNYFSILNVTLAVFNLIPIPPLDGSRVLMCFLPDRQYSTILLLEHFGSILLIILVVMHKFDFLLAVVNEYVLKYFYSLFSGLTILRDVLIMI